MTHGPFTCLRTRKCRTADPSHCQEMERCGLLELRCVALAHRDLMRYAGPTADITLGRVVDIENDTCAICHVSWSCAFVGSYELGWQKQNQLMVPCITCEAEPHHAEECSVAWGQCGHSYHFHCITRWLRTRSTCPLGWFVCVCFAARPLIVASVQTTKSGTLFNVSYSFRPSVPLVNIVIVD